MKRLSKSTKMRGAIFAFLLAFAVSVSAQVQVQGTVVDEQGDALIGASVQIQGTTQGTTTDVNGRFTLSAPAGGTLVISFMGYATQYVPVSATVSVRLVPDAELLGEIVVTALGISRSDRALGSAVTRVDPSQAMQRAEPDLFRALSGRIPGVQVGASSSVAGSATRISIRGNSSFHGSNEPLIVVDGIPFSNQEVVTTSRLTQGAAVGTALGTLDPNDIESMTVLRGAAAAALYGSRAANGVILITTRSGAAITRPSQRGTEVTIATSYAWENASSLPTFQNSFGQGSFMNFNAGSIGSWGAPFQGPGSRTEFDAREFVTSGWPRILAEWPSIPYMQQYKAHPNNVRDLFRTGGLLDLSANVSNVNDRGNFNLTVSNTGQDGFIPFSDFSRTSVSVGGHQRLDNGLRVGGTLSFSETEQNGPFFGAGNFTGSVSSFNRAMHLPRNLDMTLPYQTPQGHNLFVLTGVDNPLWSWRNNRITTQTQRTVSTINLGYDITPWLSVSYRAGWNEYGLNRRQIINIGSVGNAGLGEITQDQFRSQELESILSFTFQHDFGEDYSLAATLGHNANQRRTSRFANVGDEMIAPGIYSLFNTVTQMNIADSHTKRRLWAVFADVTFGFRHFLYLNASLRNDHSSTLPKANNNYWYPAFTSSFVFTEAFDMPRNIFDFGTLRLAWGMVGNDASPYFNDGTFRLGTPWDGRPTMFLPTTLFDPNLRPEFTREFEVGTDIRMFRNRFNIDVAWYNRVTTDQIATITLPHSTGASTQWTNLGKVRNRGVEIGLSVTPIDMANSLRWEIFSTFTHNRNVVLALWPGAEEGEFIPLSTGTTSPPLVRMMPGKPFGALFGTKIERDTDGTPLVSATTGRFIEQRDVGFLGDPNPDFISAITNTFSFRGLSLSFMFNMSVGGVIYSGVASDLLGRGVTRDTEDRFGARILPGVLADPNSREVLRDEANNRIVNNIAITENDLWFNASGQPTFALNSVSEMRIFDATVFSLSEIVLGYDIPRRWLQNTFIGSAHASIVARGLWHYAPGFPRYTNYNPGSNSFGAGNIQGIDRETAPTTRRIGVNLRFTI